MWLEYDVQCNPISEINQELFHDWYQDRGLIIKTDDDLRCAIKVYVSGIQDYLIDAFNLDADIEEVNYDTDTAT